MGLVSRGPRLAAAVALGALLAGCGSSVADADRPITTTRAAPSGLTPFCSAVQANSDAIRPLNALSVRSGISPEELTNTVDTVRRTSATLLNAAPDDIRADVQRTVDATNLQLDALVAAGGDPVAAARNPSVNAQLNSPEVTAASQRLTSYITRNCGVGGVSTAR